MDRSKEIDAAVADVYVVLQQMYREDVGAGAVAPLQVPSVESDGFLSRLAPKDGQNTLAWALKLDPKDPRLSSVDPAMKLFAELAHVAPYNTRPNDGWEVIVAIAIASRSFDFFTNGEFDLAAILLRVREGLIRDLMVERTIWGIFGLKIDSMTKIGDRSWLLPATVERKSHVAIAKRPTYPLIHAHGYLLSDRIASSEDLRSAQRDPLPRRILNALRAAARPDMWAVGPWFETTIMLPSRFAGFRTHSETPELPLNYMYPAGDVQFTQVMADEAVELDRLMNTEPPKQLKHYVRSIQLAINRLSMATSRNNVHDALLDLMISLEALLSKQGEKTEIAYRIALRGAYACSADNPERRTDVRKMLSDAYDLRSEIVHGAKREPEIPAPVVNQLRGFIATTIRLSAFALTSGSPLVEQIETALLGDRAMLASTLAKLSADGTTRT